MYGRGALLVVCFLLVAPKHCQILATTNRFAVPLDLSGAPVQATAECGRDANGDPVETTFCTSASTCDICNASESERSYPARAAVDGYVATAWQSPPLSQGEEFRAVNFTLDLGQRFTVTSLTLRSGASPLPAVWTLHGSRDGITGFTPWRAFEAGDAPQGREVTVDLSQDSSQTVAVATSILLELLQARAVQDANDTRQQFYSISELSVVGVCAEVTGCSECGYCLEQLTVQITNLTELINTTLIQLPEPTLVINMTILNTLQENITGVQSDVEHLEGTLLVLEVAVGTRDELPDNTTLPDSVVRLDLELVPPLLQKLQQLRQLVDSTQEFSFDTNTLMSILVNVETLLRDSILNATRLESRVTAYLVTLGSALERLTTNLNETREARQEAQSINTTVASRQYDNITQDLNMVTADANTVLSMGEVFLDQAERNRREATVIDEGLDRVEPGLGDVTETAQGALEEAAAAQNNSRRVDELIREIEELVAIAESLNSSVDGTVEAVQELVERGEQLLQRASELTESSRTSLSTLTSLHLMFSTEVREYRDALSPYRIPSSCNTTICTRGDIHAEELFRNLSEIRNSSVTIYTLRYAHDFLARLNFTGQLFNYSAINQTALQAQDVSRTALGRLDTLDLPLLLNSTSRALAEAQSLRNRSPSILNQAEDAANLVNTTVDRYDRLYSDLQMLRDSAEGTMRDAQNLLRQTGLRTDAEQLATVSRMAQNLTTDVGERVRAMEGKVGEVRRRVEGTAENVARTEDVLNETELMFPTIRTFLSATREIADVLERNITNFLTENDRIIANIDSLISGLEGTHTLINRINSPVRLANEQTVNPYISLQPPPGRRLTDTIQFESLDLYLWPSSQYVMPAFLFYAGPVYFPGSEESSATGVREDFLMLTAESPSGLLLQWQLGENMGDVRIDERIQGFHEIFIVRVGSRFQFNFRSGMNFENTAQEMTVVNDSLLFHTSNRTAFLLGGWPEGAQLGLPSSPLPLSQYSRFFGQFQLLLFNGQQWGLWNIRGASRSDFIGSGDEFRMNSLASENRWRSRSTVAISFTGNGYLKVGQLANIPNLRSPSDLRISMRPIDISDGLVLYAYDTTLQVSLEVAFRNGFLRLLFRQHSNSPQMLVNYTQPTTARDVNLQIEHAQRTNVLRLQRSAIYMGIQTYFTDLTRVQAWYGGVQEDMLEGSYVPEITNRSYVGCIDVVVLQPERIVFTRPFFEEQYLNSSIQRGLSATCLSTVYARDLGLAGGTNDYLSYSYFRREGPADDMSYTLNVISLSFFPVNQTGVIFAGLAGENRVYVVMREEVLEVGIKQSQGATPTILRTQGSVTIEEWHYLLISLSNDSTLYLDGIEQQSARLPGFSFNLPTAGNQPVLFLGGIDRGTPGFQEIVNVPTFRGCLKDFGYNYRAMSFLNEALSQSRRNVAGATYRSCPFVTTPRIPILAVRPNQPDQRECLSQTPTQLQHTHGGFHRDTQLNTSNVLGLFDRSWTLSMQLKYTEGGQVVRVGSQQGHLIFLRVDEGRVGLSLVGENGAQQEVTHTRHLARNVFTNVSVTCTVGGGTLSCSLSVENDPSSEMTQVPYSDSLFFPALPLVFGRTINSSGSIVESFVGCLSGLAINGDSSGFIDPVVNTDIPCFNNTEPGLGFTGISVLGESLPPVNSSQSNTITVNFKPLRENGLLLLLTQDSDPVFAVGIFNGEVRLSNFSSPGQFGTLPEAVCDAGSHSVVATYNATSISVAIDNGTPLISTLSRNLEGRGLTLTLGNTPRNFAIPQGSELFSFLLSRDGSENTDSQPPGFVGCVMGRRVQADAVEVGELLNGFCPISD